MHHANSYTPLGAAGRAMDRCQSGARRRDRLGPADVAASAADAGRSHSGQYHRATGSSTRKATGSTSRRGTTKKAPPYATGADTRSHAGRYSPPNLFPGHGTARRTGAERLVRANASNCTATTAGASDIQCRLLGKPTAAVPVNVTPSW